MIRVEKKGGQIRDTIDGIILDEAITHYFHVLTRIIFKKDTLIGQTKSVLVVFFLIVPGTKIRLGKSL